MGEREEGVVRDRVREGGGEAMRARGNEGEGE